MIKVHIIGDVLLEGRGMSSATGGGPVCVIGEDEDLQNFNAGEVLVIRKTTDEVLQLIKNAAAVVTEEDGVDSESVIVGKALNIPVVSNAHAATEILKSGTVVTVEGRTGKIYSGSRRL